MVHCLTLLMRAAVNSRLRVNVIVKMIWEVGRGSRRFPGWACWLKCFGGKGSSGIVCVGEKKWKRKRSLSG